MQHRAVELHIRPRQGCFPPLFYPVHAMTACSGRYGGVLAGASQSPGFWGDNSGSAWIVDAHTRQQNC